MNIKVPKKTEDEVVKDYDQKSNVLAILICVQLPVIICSTGDESLSTFFVLSDQSMWGILIKKHIILKLHQMHRPAG